MGLASNEAQKDAKTMNGMTDNTTTAAGPHAVTDEKGESGRRGC